MSPLRSTMRRVKRPVLTGLTQPGAGGGGVSIVNNGVLADYVTFTRASTGTYFDSAGVMQTAAIDTPRIDYDPATLALRGLLVQPQRTNLVINSASFDAASWAKAGGASVTANSTVAPDGATTADTLVAGTGGDISRTFTATSGQQYTASIFIKKTTGATTFPMVAINATATFAQVILNTNTGAASVRSGVTGATDLAVQDCDDFWRLSFVGTPDSVSPSMRIFPAASTNGTDFTAGLSGSVVAWGAQVELGIFPTSYIPTAATAQTRSIDDPDFTIPAGVVRLEYTYDDGTTFNEAVTPGAAYQIPTGQKRIKSLKGFFS